MKLQFTAASATTFLLTSWFGHSDSPILASPTATGWMVVRRDAAWRAPCLPRAAWKVPMGLNASPDLTWPFVGARGRILATLLLTLAIIVGTSGMTAMAAPLGNSAAAQRGIAPPDVTAQAVYAIDLDSGAVLYSKNADEQRPIASITKVVTALVVVQHVALDEQVTIIESDQVQPPFTSMGARPGDTLTVSELLQGLLLPSGGDAANALARYVGGKLANSTDIHVSMNAFMDEMNNYAKSLGLTESYFTTPDGDDDTSAFSSAHDLAILGAELMKNADLAWIVSQPSVSLASQNGPSYDLVTTNRMMTAGDEFLLSCSWFVREFVH